MCIIKCKDIVLIQDGVFIFNELFFNLQWMSGTFKKTNKNSI